LVPIVWENNTVSFQCRDFTEKATLRYITCPKSREIIHHKNILYGKQSSWTDRIIVCEGVFDVFRFGVNSVATFGIQFKQEQVRQIKKYFKQVFVAFDDEPQAINKAEKLVSELRFRGITSERIPIVGDPGGMNQKDADYLVKTYIKKGY
jgi:DNA primase